MPATSHRRGAAVVTAVVGAVAVTALDAALLAWALGGPRALLRHERALALLAAWGLGGIVLALIRPVRSHDPVAMRADQRYAVLALFVIPLVTPAVSAYSERIGAWLLPGGAVLRWLGVLVSASGLALRIAAMARLGSRFSPVITVQRDHPLETGGLYAVVRHPGYLGALLTALGGALAFGSVAGLALSGLMAWVLDGRIRREEELLGRHFGAEYERYRARTGRLLPRLAAPRAPLDKPRHP